MRGAVRVTALVLGWVLAGSAVPVGAGDDAGAPSEPRQRHCLWLPALDRVQIVDDYTLVFHMKGGEKYVNVLPYRCAGLKSRGTFLHETATNNYCDLDIITVIDTSTGMRLNSCPLGRFELTQGGADD